MMIPCCDFHTHILTGKYPELLSTPFPSVAPYRSLEYHPWYLPESFSPLPEHIGNTLPDFTALGEVGLDRLRGPELPVQMQYLSALLSLAQDCQKPVILHVVRALPELFSLLKKHKLQWVIHGFRGKADALEAIWQHGGIVSFHPQAVERRDLMEKLAAPDGKFGFESDDNADIDLAQVITMAADRSGNCDLPQLAAAAFGEITSEQ